MSLQNIFNATLLQLALAPAPGPGPGGGIHGSWDGLKYLANISVIGGITCILLFLLVKLQDDHRLPHPVHLIRKLIAVWHTTDDQIAKLCGADASDYLALLRVTFVILALLALPGLLVILPVNIYAGDVPVGDQLVAATMSHLPTGSLWFWVHVAFVCLVCAVVHHGLEQLAAHLHATRFREADALDTVAAFTVMIQGVPRGLARDKQSLVEYFEHLYPGKIYHICVPQDLVTFLNTRACLKKLRKHLEKARAMAEAEAAEEEREQRGTDYGGWVSEGEDSDLQYYQPLASAVGEDVGLVLSEDEEVPTRRGSRRQRRGRPWTVPKELWRGLWRCICGRRRGNWRRYFWACGGWEWRDEVRWVEEKIEDEEDVLKTYREGTARGAGIAFIVFKDVFTATRALRDASWKAPHRQQPHLATRRWQAERAPPPGKVLWHNVGSSAMGRRLRSWLVNCAVLCVLLFWSSPLAMITAVNSATERLDPEAVSHFHSWLAWAKGSSWLAALFFQFLPNALIFLAMYCYIPKALSYLSKFERHVTVSGEQQATLVKMVCFFLVNLFLLKATVETTLESAILHFGQCYTDPAGCPGVEHWFSNTFIGSSSLSALAFLITSSLLGVSLDLLSPVWMIQRSLKRLQIDRTGRLSAAGDYVHSLTVELESEGTGRIGGGQAQLERERELQRPDSLRNHPNQQYSGSLGHLFAEQDLTEYPPPLSAPLLEQQASGLCFDFPQYHSYNLTAFAMALLYSSAAPLVLPAGAFFFFYRFCVDKYNFLFIYRSSASPAATDGRVMGTVLKVMRVLLCSYIATMAIFFALRGDNEKLQMLVTLLVLLVLACRFGVEKLVGLPQERGLDGFFVQGLGTVEQLVQGGVVGYERLSRSSRADWTQSSL